MSVLALLAILAASTVLLIRALDRRRHPQDYLPPAALDRIRRQAYELRDREGEAFDV